MDKITEINKTIPLRINLFSLNNEKKAKQMFLLMCKIFAKPLKVGEKKVV